MEERIKLSRNYIIITLSMIVIGLVALVIAFSGDPQRAWANYLLNNVYFLSLAIGAMFFLSIQRVSHSGWSAGFLRVPEAMGAYIPVAAVLFLLMIPGVHSLYHWSHADAVLHDPLLAHKAPYLNLPFWVLRMVVFFGFTERGCKRGTRTISQRGALRQNFHFHCDYHLLICHDRLDYVHRCPLVQHHFCHP
jgi:hypothetical protein